MLDFALQCDEDRNDGAGQCEAVGEEFAVGLSVAGMGWIKPPLCADLFPWRGLDLGWRRGAQEGYILLKAMLGSSSLGTASSGDRLSRNANFFPGRIY